MYKNHSQSKSPSQEKIGKIQKRSIVDEMQESYLDYAMSVIVQRALPDVRDGLKPGQRRILYAMWNLGLKANAKFRKSATVVGEVLGKYHPHGDAAVYDTMVRMAQNFSLRYPLINGQGNFGSLDGDNAAAMRYTEAKLKPIAEELLYDIEKETVEFVDNYDATLKEPQVLPAKIPNLLLNGASGIAVGMATSIPPHNISELCDGIIYLIDNPEASVSDLMQYIKGPDFPTGATIFNKKEIKNAYATGKGSIVMRANAEIVETRAKTFQIIISQIPYQVNKADLLVKIATLVTEKKIDGIKDIRDESSKGEVRIVIELKKDSFPRKILNQLYKHTDLQSAFHVNMLALVNGIQPKVLTLKMILEEYINHRRHVVRKRTSFDLIKAKDRAHILEGLVMALEDIDKIITTIKKSKDKDDAKKNLIKRFKLSERQSVAILEMKLQQLANLERLKVEEELKEKKKLIKELSQILKKEKLILGIIKDDLKEIKNKYGDERRTKVVAHGVDTFSAEDLIPDEPTMIMVTRDGYIKRLAPETFKTQSRGGKGVIGLTRKEEDIVEHFFTARTHSDLLFFSSRGRVYKLKVYEIPVASRTAKGQSVVNFLQLTPNERITALRSMADLKDYKYLIMATTQGLVKKVDIDSFSNIRRSGLIAIKLKNEDQLKWIKPSSGKNEVLITTAQGQAIRFKERAVRAMGRVASGVKGIRLRKDDVVIGMDIIDTELAKSGQLFIVTENGFGKKTSIKHYKTQGRGGSGIKTAKITPKNKRIVTAVVTASQEGDIIVISEKGQVIRIPYKSVPSLGRATQGVRLMKFKEPDDKVASVAFV